MARRSTDSHIGGLAELMIIPEEWVVPVVTKATAVDLGMVLSCVSVAGFGATTSERLRLSLRGRPLRSSGADRSGQRCSGQPDRRRFDDHRYPSDQIAPRAGHEVGATHVLDPNVEGDGIIQRVRSLSNGPTSRPWSGGRDSGGRRSGAGSDPVVEAAGAEFVRPKLEAGPDPTGILPMQQASGGCRSGPGSLRAWVGVRIPHRPPRRRDWRRLRSVALPVAAAAPRTVRRSVRRLRTRSIIPSPSRLGSSACVAPTFMASSRRILIGSMAMIVEAPAILAP